MEDSLAHLNKSHDQLQAQLIKELPTCSPIAINVDACATNWISCEASILKENVELRAQLKLLTSNYEILEESHGKLSSSHEDLLVSHDKLKLAHEAISTKVISSETHVDNGTTSTKNATMPCASPCTSSSDRKSTRLNSSHITRSRMPSSA